MTIAKYTGYACFAEFAWWRSAPAKLVRPAFKLHGIFGQWALLVRTASRTLHSSGLQGQVDWAGSLLRQWRDLCDEFVTVDEEIEWATLDFASAVSREFSQVEVYFATTDSFKWPSGEWHASTHDCIVGLLWKASTHTDTTYHIVGASPRPEILANAILENSQSIEEYSGVNLMSLVREDTVRQLQRRLEKEVQRAWLEWQRLPSYKGDPDAKVTLTAKEEKKLIDAKRKSVGRPDGLRDHAERYYEFFFRMKGEFTTQKNYAEWKGLEPSTISISFNRVREHFKCTKPSQEDLENFLEPDKILHETPPDD